MSSERAASTTLQPTSTARRAVAAPMPVLAPVMTSTGVGHRLRFYHCGCFAPWPPRIPPRPASRRCRSTRGHYESFYLKACHPAEPLGVWIRYTVHKRPGEPPNGSLWFTLFDGAPGGRARTR